MADSPKTVIYLSADGPIIKDISEPYRPTGAQALLRVAYSGINPADINFVRVGLHSSVAGYDMSGEVLESGPDSPFKPGDKIFGLNSVGIDRPLYLGAHQDYAIAESPFWYKIPSSGKLTLRDAAILPVMTLTAADAFFHLLGLAFPAVGITGSESQALLIWGGASSVGLAAIQLAKAAGHGPIFVTASGKNHATLKALGANYCFDYKDGDVVEQIKEAIQGSGKTVRHALDAVAVGVFAEGDEFKKSSAALAAECISQHGQDTNVKLASVLPVMADPRYKICFATRASDSPLEIGRVANAEAWNAMQATVMDWVTSNYGEGKYVGCPNITVVKGTRECLEAMGRSAEGKCSLEKIAVEHPF